MSKVVVLILCSAVRNGVMIAISLVERMVREQNPVISDSYGSFICDAVAIVWPQTHYFILRDAMRCTGDMTAA